MRSTIGGSITLGYSTDNPWRVPGHLVLRYFSETQNESLVSFPEWADEIADVDYITESEYIIEILSLTSSERRIQKLKRLDEEWQNQKKNIPISSDNPLSSEAI